MKALPELCRVTLEIWDRLDKDSRKDLIPGLGKLFKKGVIVFDEEYKVFMEDEETGVVSDPGRFDRWLNVQLQFLTELGDKKPLLELFEAVKEIFSETPGGESFTYPENPSLSYLAALAIRNFVDMIAVEEEVPQPANPKERVK